MVATSLRVPCYHFATHQLGVCPVFPSQADFCSSETVKAPRNPASRKPLARPQNMLPVYSKGGAFRLSVLASGTSLLLIDIFCLQQSFVPPGAAGFDSPAANGLF